MTYEITYDLNKPGQNYPGLHEAIKNLGSWAHVQESTWIVKTSLSAAQIRDRLAPQLDQRDTLLVTGLTGEWASWGLAKEFNDWLLKNAA